MKEQLRGRQADLFNARAGWGEILDGYVQKRLIVNRLFFADARTLLVELLISFAEQNDPGVVGNFLKKLRMFLHVAVELDSQETMTFCKDTQKNGPFLSRRSCHSFKTDEWHLRSQGNEVQFFKTDDLSGSILHQDDIVAGFFAQVFLIGVSEPHRQRVSDRVEEQLYFRFHISVPFLMTAVR